MAVGEDQILIYIYCKLIFQQLKQLEILPF